MKDEEWEMELTFNMPACILAVVRIKVDNESGLHGDPSWVWMYYWLAKINALTCIISSESSNVLFGTWGRASNAALHWYHVGEILTECETLNYSFDRENEYYTKG